MTKRHILAGLVLGGVIAVGVLGLGVGQGSGSNYITALVEKGPVLALIKATGTVEPVISIDVSSQLSGRISEVLVNFNDEVRAGQAIARIDPELFAARVAEAKAVLRVAQAAAEQQKAALHRAKVVLESVRTASKVAQLQVAAARVTQEEAERTYQRYLLLSRTGSASDREFTQARAVRDAGAATMRAQDEDLNVKTLAIGIAEAEVAMAHANLQNAEATVQQREAVLEQTELDLARTFIRAPVDGVIIKRDVNPGQTVAITLEAKTLFKIAQDLREMELRGKIDEADVGKIRVGQTAQFTVDAYPDRTFAGRVLQVRKSPEVNQNVVTYTAIVSAPNADLLLLPGMTAVLRIIITDTGDSLRLSNQALRYRPVGAPATPGALKQAQAGKASVWVLRAGGYAEPVEITLGAADDNNTEVLAGSVREGQHVVVGTATPLSRAGIFGLRLGF